LPDVWAVEVGEGTTDKVVVGAFEVTEVDGEEVCGVVLIFVEAVDELAQETKTRDINVKTINTIQIFPLFIFPPIL
jgi:hypothetical protein